MRRLAAVVALGVLTACGGADPAPSADPTPTASPTTKKPRPKKPRATKSATARPTTKPTPTATPTPTPPPATGDPVGTQEALVHLIDPGETRRADDCAAAAPDMTRPACTRVETAGGTLISVTGRLEGRKAVRFLVSVPGGFVNRYEGRDDGRSWGQLRVYAAPLTGKGLDGVVLSVRLTDGALTYDVLTWVEGGPLILRAHRGPLAEGAVLPREVALEEYERAVDGSYVRRRLAWDGRRFLISAGQRAAAPPR